MCKTFPILYFPFNSYILKYCVTAGSVGLVASSVVNVYIIDELIQCTSFPATWCLLFSHFPMKVPSLPWMFVFCAL